MDITAGVRQLVSSVTKMKISFSITISCFTRMYSDREKGLHIRKVYGETESKSLFYELWVLLLTETWKWKTWRHGYPWCSISGSFSGSSPPSLLCHVYLSGWIWARWLVLSSHVIKTPGRMCVLIGGNEQKPSLLSRVSGNKIFKTTLNATDWKFCFDEENLSVGWIVFPATLNHFQPSVANVFKSWTRHLSVKRFSFQRFRRFGSEFRFLRHGEDISSVSQSSMSQKIQLHSLSGSLGEPRRTYFQGENIILVEIYSLTSLKRSSFAVRDNNSHVDFLYSFYFFSRSKVAKVELTCSTKCKLICKVAWL